MKASATKYGIDKFIYPEIGPQLTLVDQTGCTYNNTMSTPEIPNDKVALDHIHTLKMDALEQTTLDVVL